MRHAVARSRPVALARHAGPAGVGLIPAAVLVFACLDSATLYALAGLLKALFSVL